MSWTDHYKVLAQIDDWALVEEEPCFIHLCDGSKLRAEGNKLRAEGLKLCVEGSKLYEGNKLYAEGRKLREEGRKLYDEGSKLCAEGDRIWLDGYELHSKCKSKPSNELIALNVLYRGE